MTERAAAVQQGVSTEGHLGIYEDTSLLPSLTPYMATGAAARIAAGGGTVKSDGTKKDKKRKREKNDDMKRTGYPRRGTCTGRWVLAIVLAGGLLASCSTSDSEDTMPLPEGKFPLQLTAEVTQPQTRAGGKDAWTGGEEIRVAMEGVFGTKTYVMTHRAMQARRMPTMPSTGRTPPRRASRHGH